MKSTILSIIIAGIVIVGAIVLSEKQTTNIKKSDSINNVSVVNGVQIIDFTAKGGYEPRQSIAQSGIHTILRVTTNGTFDCSSSVRIPSLNISKFLPQTGETEIDIGNPKPGILDGTCGMGMYRFQIEFK